MRKSLFLMALPLVFLISCGSRYTFRSISEFKIDTTALKNDEQVRIIYFTGGPDNAPKVDYYYHYIVVSMQTNDTVNVLSSWRVPVGTEEDPRYFIKEGTDVSLVMENLDQLVKGGNVKDLKPHQLDKVISNRKYRKFEENNYPTMIGFFAESVTPAQPTKDTTSTSGDSTAVN